MSWEVQHAYWHFWRPGQQIELRPSDPEWSDFEAYCRRARTKTSIYRLALLALAMDANAILSVYGESEHALCWTSVDVLAEALQVSGRTVQRMIRELERWGELQVKSCSGYCHEASYPHHGTNHYILPLPEGAQPWGRKTKRQSAKARRKRSQV